MCIRDRLHLVHDAGGAGVAQLAAALQQAGGGLTGVDDHIHGLLEHGVRLNQGVPVTFSYFFCFLKTVLLLHLL